MDQALLDLRATIVATRWSILAMGIEKGKLGVMVVAGTMGQSTLIRIGWRSTSAPPGQSARLICLPYRIIIRQRWNQPAPKPSRCMGSLTFRLNIGTVATGLVWGP